MTKYTVKFFCGTDLRHKAEVEQRLGLEQGALDGEWIGEETAEDAWTRKLAPRATTA